MGKLASTDWSRLWLDGLRDPRNFQEQIVFSRYAPKTTEKLVVEVMRMARVQLPVAFKFCGVWFLHEDYKYEIVKYLDSKLSDDCRQPRRTTEWARECKCLACKRWWCENVPGYFICPKCLEVRLLDADGPYDGVCEQCFDEAQESQT